MTTDGSPPALERAPDEGAGARRPLARELAGAGARATGVDLAWRAGAALLAGQLVLMVVSSTAEYHRYDLTRDFSGYSQAWSSIAHGSLDPFSTVFDVRFWRNDLELVLWPLALVAKVFPSPISLLYTQGLAVVLAELVAARSSRRAGALVAVLALGWLAVASHLQAVGGGGTGLASWYGYLAFPNSFPSWTAIPFLVVGGAMVLVRLACRGDVRLAGRVGAKHGDARRRAAARRTLVATSCVVGASAVALLLRHAPAFAGYADRVGPAAVARLDAVERTIPAGAEVVASQGVSGRFADGHLPLRFWANGADDTVPVDRRTVVLVFAPTQGVAQGASGITRHAIARVEHVLHARALVARGGIWAFEWTPPSGTRAVSFSTSAA